jgi:hypothetical protein
MTVTLDLDSDLEQRLRTEAATRGLPLESYLLSVLQNTAGAAPAEDASLEEFEAAMDAFSAGTEELPVLPPEAFTRESIYEGR